MLKRIDDFIQDLNNESAKLYAKGYFKVIFTDEELNQILPLLKSSWKDYLDINRKQIFIDQLEVASTKNTKDKVVFIINKLNKIYSFDKLY